MRPKNPGVEALIKSNRTSKRTGSTIDLEVFQKYQNEPSTKAREALEQLFRQVQGLPPLEFPQLNSYAGPAYYPIEGGDIVALRDYARLIREHVQNLNSLIPTHREYLLSVFQERELDRFLATYGQKRPLSRIAMLVAELLYWAEVCQKPAKPKLILAFAPAPLSRKQCLDALYTCNDETCSHPIIARLCKHLGKRERKAARLKAPNSDSIAAWENFVRTLFDDCFKDRRCAQFLTRHFTAPSRKQKKGVGLLAYEKKLPRPMRGNHNLFDHCHRDAPAKNSFTVTSRARTGRHDTTQTEPRSQRRANQNHGARLQVVLHLRTGNNRECKMALGAIPNGGKLSRIVESRRTHRTLDSHS
jgi:hypothetical protein